MNLQIKVMLKATDIQLLQTICGALCDLVPFVQFKKGEKHPRRSVNFSKVAGFSKSLSSKYGSKLLHITKMLTMNACKTAPKRAIQKTAEATGYLVGNKIAEKITRIASKGTLKDRHCVKCVQIRSFFWFVFSGIWTENGVSLRIQSEFGKIRTRKNSAFGHFSRSAQIDQTSAQPTGVPKERYILPERQKKNIDKLQLL